MNDIPTTPELSTLVQPTPPATPPSSNKMMVVIVGVLVVLGLAYAGYTFLGGSVAAPQQGASKNDDAPPSLQAAAEDSGLKGSFIGGKKKCLNYEQKDIDAFAEKEKALIAAGAIASEVKKDINYFITTKDTNPAEIMGTSKGIGNLNPQSKCAIFAYYASGEDGREDKFYTYPEEVPFIGTAPLKDEDAEKFMIPRGRGVIIISQYPSKVYELQAVEKPLTEPAKLISEALGNWFLIGSTSEKTEEAFAAYKNRIENSAPAGQYLTWLKLKAGKNVADVPKVEKNTPKNPTIKVLLPDTITIAPPSATPVLGEPVKVKISGNDLDDMDTIAFSDKNVTATISGGSSYEINTLVSVQPNTTEGTKKFTITAKDGTNTKGSIKVAYSNPAKSTIPVFTKISPTVVYLDDKTNKYFDVEGEQLDSAFLTFDDPNMKEKGSMNPTKTSFSGEVEIDKKIVSPGIKKVKIHDSSKQAIYDTPHTVLVLNPENESKEAKIDFIAQSSYVIGSGPMTLDAYGTNLDKFNNEKKKKEVNFLQKYYNTSSEIISNEHVKLIFSDMPGDIKPGKNPLGGNLTIGKDAIIEFTNSALVPKISKVSINELESGLSETTPITIEGTNFDKKTKISLVYTYYNSLANVDILSITSTKIEAEISVPVITKEYGTTLKISNDNGMDEVPFTIKKSSAEPKIVSFEPSSFDFDMKDPVKMVIKGVNMDKVKNVSIHDEKYYKELSPIKIISATKDQLEVSFIPSYMQEATQAKYNGGYDPVLDSVDLTVNVESVTGADSDKGGLIVLKSKKNPSITSIAKQLKASPVMWITVVGDNLISPTVILVNGKSYYYSNGKALEYVYYSVDNKNVGISVKYEYSESDLGAKNNSIEIVTQYGIAKSPPFDFIK